MATSGENYPKYKVRGGHEVPKMKMKEEKPESKPKEKKKSASKKAAKKTS